MVKATFTGLVCFLLFLLVHVIIFRYRRPEERFKTLSVIFFSLSPFYVIAYFLLPPWQGIYSLEGALVFLSGLFLYIFLFLGYCQFYFIVDRSISVRVMIEIEKSATKSHDFDEIKKVYSFDRVLSRRLEHMVHSGYLSREADHYMNTRKGRFVAYLFRFLKDFLRIGPGG
jgi:Zn-dependent protease with chaperone function